MFAIVQVEPDALGAREARRSPRSPGRSPLASRSCGRPTARREWRRRSVSTRRSTRWPIESIAAASRPSSSVRPSRGERRRRGPARSPRRRRTSSSTGAEIRRADDDHEHRDDRRDQQEEETAGRRRCRIEYDAGGISRGRLAANRRQRLLESPSYERPIPLPRPARRRCGTRLAVEAVLLVRRAPRSAWTARRFSLRRRRVREARPRGPRPGERRRRPRRHEERVPVGVGREPHVADRFRASRGLPRRTAARPRWRGRHDAAQLVRTRREAATRRPPRQARLLRARRSRPPRRRTPGARAGNATTRRSNAEASAPLRHARIAVVEVVPRRLADDARGRPDPDRRGRRAGARAQLAP